MADYKAGLKSEIVDEVVNKIRGPVSEMKVERMI